MMIQVNTDVFISASAIVYVADMFNGDDHYRQTHIIYGNNRDHFTTTLRAADIAEAIERAEDR